MKKIAIVIPKGAVMPSGVISAYFLLSEANAFKAASGMEPPFEIQLLGYEPESKLYDGFVSIQAHGTFEDAAPGTFDLVLIPGFTTDMDIPLKLNQPLIAWLSSQHGHGKTELASICTGAFILAATGAAEGKQMTTHWAFEQDFRRRYPRVKLMPEKIVTDDQGIYASGGAYSALNLLLYLIEKFCDSETALWLSKVFQIDMGRASQKPFVIFNLQKMHTDDSVAKVQAHIEQHFDQPLIVTELATQFAFSRRNFIRRFKEATGNTPIEYIQRVRIEAAKRLLESTAKSVEEIIFSCGYNDGKAFRDIFRKLTGFTPLVYRDKYGRR